MGMQGLVVDEGNITEPRAALVLIAGKRKHSLLRRANFKQSAPRSR